MGCHNPLAKTWDNFCSTRDCLGVFFALNKDRLLQISLTNIGFLRELFTVPTDSDASSLRFIRPLWDLPGIVAMDLARPARHGSTLAIFGPVKQNPLWSLHVAGSEVVSHRSSSGICNVNGVHLLIKLRGR